MSKQGSNKTEETYISQRQWLPNEFMVGTALEGDDSFFEALAQGMNLLSDPYGSFNVTSLRQACSEYARDHQDWHQVITEDAVKGGYATSSGQQADFISYLVRIQLTAKVISVLQDASPAVRGRPNIEGRMLCQRYGIKLHLIEKHTTDSEEFAHELVDSEESRPISVDENFRLFNEPGIIHILNERGTHFVPLLPKTIVSEKPNEKQGHMPTLEGADSQQNQLDRIPMHPVQSSRVNHSSPKSKLDLIGEEQNDVHAKKRCVVLPGEEEEFQASGLKQSLHGIAYQWKLLMLFAFNSHQLGYDFRLATEMSAAEKFDDVVLQYVKAGSDVKHFRFLQAKHFQTESDNKKITAKDLLQKEDGKFTLQKYFRSFQKIKRNLLFQSGELQDFIICTNIDFEFDNGFQHQSLKKLYHEEPLYLEPVTEADKMLNVGGKRYRIVSSSYPERQAVVSVLKAIFDETSECRKLAKMLAEHLVDGKGIKLHGLFKEYHIPLASFVFNIRDNKLAKKFVVGKLDDQSCPGAHAFHEALHEAIVERLTEQPTKQNKLPPKKKKLTHHGIESGTLWNDIGKLELKFSDSFRRAFVPHLEPQLRDPTSLAEEIAHLINTKKTLDEAINVVEGEETILKEELPHLAGHVFVKQGARVVFSHKFLTGNSLAGNIQDLWNALCKVLDVNNCHLSKCTFNITNFETCKEDELKGLAELQVTDEEVQEFLDHLIFAVNQPNEKRLIELISDKLGQELSLTDGDLITSDFQSRMLDWLKKKEGTYQSERTVGNFLCDLQEKVCQLILIGPTCEHVKTLEKYEIEFNDNALPAALKKFLEDETSVFNYITDPKQTFLGSIKVNQVRKDISTYKAQGSFIFISLKKLLPLEEKDLMAFRKEQSNLLIVECKEETASQIEEPAGQIKTLSRKLSEILKERCGKKVILIAPHNHPLASQFKTGEHKPRYQEMVGEFKFGDLTSDSQKILLEKTVKFQGTEIALNKLMSADSAITKMLPLASLIEGKKLEIGQHVKVSNVYDEVFYIERTLNFQSDKNPTSYSAENLHKFMLQAQRQVSLIPDIAGMGKTTILTHLAKQIKQNFPCHWVVKIDLNDHTDALEAQNQQRIEAVEFLSQRLLKLDSPFDKKLFKQRLKEGKLVVMLDGVDEISPNYEKTVIDLLQALKEKSIQQLWVTTRPHLRETLEKNLQPHSYTLEPFSKGDQVEFLTKFWYQKLNLQGTSQQQLDKFATAIIEKLEESINDREKEFTGIPLQTRLLAEGFNQSDVSEHNLPDTFDLLGLYKRFTERKYDIYWEEKTKIPKGNVPAKVQRERDLRIVTEEQQCLALQMLFPEEVVGIFGYISQSALEPQELARYGIVHYLDNKPNFIHRTFAEYYVADILIDKLSKETTPGQELPDFLLKDILLRQKYEVVCSFLDGFLEKHKLLKGILEQSGKRICELWQDDADGCIGQKLLGSLRRTILHQAAQEGHTHIIRYLLDSLKAGQHLEMMRDLFLTKDEMGQIAWHLSAENGHLQTSEGLWDWANQAKVNLKDDIVLAKDSNDHTAWHLATRIKPPGVMRKLKKCTETELSQQELKNLLLTKDKEGKTIWHLAAWRNYPHVFENLMEWAKKANLNQQEFKAVLLEKDDEGRTRWHSGTLNNHPDVYEWVTKVIENPQEQEELLKKLFLDKDYDGQTIWHLAARSFYPDVFKKLLDVADKVLSKEELWPLLLTKDMMGKTAWHLLAENGRANSLNTLWEWAKKGHINENELKNNWLLSQDSSRTAWHLAAQRGHINVLKKLWDWATEMNLNHNKDLLLVRDVSRRIAWQVAEEMGKTGILEEIFDW